MMFNLSFTQNAKAGPAVTFIMADNSWRTRQATDWYYCQGSVTCESIVC